MQAPEVEAGGCSRPGRTRRYSILEGHLELSLAGRAGLCRCPADPNAFEPCGPLFPRLPWDPIRTGASGLRGAIWIPERSERESPDGGMRAILSSPPSACCEKSITTDSR